LRKIRGITCAAPSQRIAIFGSWPTYLTIKEMKLFPEDPDAEIQILAIVNGMTFVHPMLLASNGW
jgi:hypothetical protein